MEQAGIIAVLGGIQNEQAARKREDLGGSTDCQLWWGCKDSGDFPNWEVHL